MLFAASTINYIDRQVLGILAPTLQADLHWTETQYGGIVSWFSLAYGVGMLFMGRALDRLGSRRGLAMAIVVWSVAAMAHALARTAGPFAAARAMLGLGESPNFPGAVKTVALWFPKRERALAVGIFNAGSNVGAVLAPLLVPWIALTWGWRTAFIATGALGFVWLFYLFWLPKFLDARWGVKLSALAAPSIAIYLFADVGSIAGGAFSSALISRGWPVSRGRKTAMLVAAILIVPTMFAPHAGSLWGTVAIVSLAAAAHQWWSANLFTSGGDMFAAAAVASVIGIGGFVGAMASMIFQRYTGSILDASHGSYELVFRFCGLSYVVALTLFQLLSPGQPTRTKSAHCA